MHLDAEEEKNMVQHLQEELIAVRLREAETISFIKELKTKIKELEDVSRCCCCKLLDLFGVTLSLNSYWWGRRALAVGVGLRALEVGGGD